MDLHPVIDSYERQYASKMNLREQPLRKKSGERSTSTMMGEYKSNFANNKTSTTYTDQQYSRVTRLDNQFEAGSGSPTRQIKARSISPLRSIKRGENALGVGE